MAEQTSKKSTAAIMILIGAVLSILFIYNAYTVNNEIDTKAVGQGMASAALNMSELESESGTSVAEAYYQNHGAYLAGEAKMYNANTRIAITNATTASLVGLTVSLGLIGLGIRSLRSV